MTTRLEPHEIYSDPDLLMEAFQQAAKQWSKEYDKFGDSVCILLRESYWDKSTAWWKIAEQVKP